MHVLRIELPCFEIGVLMIKRFRDGLDAGLKALWKPPFRSGVRNGGFEQTLRNVCMPYIEDRTGRTAFTESGQRADLLLCGAEDNPESRTRCEFKVNFAAQHSLIPARITEAKSQIERRPGPKKQAADGIVVYAIAELVMLDDAWLPAHVGRTEVIDREPPVAWNRTVLCARNFDRCCLLGGNQREAAWDWMLVQLFVGRDHLPA